MEWAVLYGASVFVCAMLFMAENLRRREMPGKGDFGIMCLWLLTPLVNLLLGGFCLAVVLHHRREDRAAAQAQKGG